MTLDPFVPYWKRIGQSRGAHGIILLLYFRRGFNDDQLSPGTDGYQRLIDEIGVSHD